MSNSADSDREYAHCRAAGLFDPAEMTGILGIEPSEFWSTTDEFERRRNTFNRKSSS